MNEKNDLIRCNIVRLVQTAINDMKYHKIDISIDTLSDYTGLNTDVFATDFIVSLLSENKIHLQSKTLTKIIWPCPTTMDEYINDISKMRKEKNKLSGDI